MKYARCAILLSALYSSLHLTTALGVTHEADVCVYGGTASGVMAAVAAAKEGTEVIIVEPSRWLGGMTGGGISHLDWGRREAVGGSAYEIMKGEPGNEIYRKIFKPESETDDEVKVKMPKNSAYFESGDPVTELGSPNAVLFSEAPFSFSSVGESFRIGHLSYYNGDTTANSEISEIGFTVAFNFETPSDQEVSLPITVRFTNLADKGDFLELSRTAGGSWPSVVLNGANYELVSTFALTAPDKHGTLSETVAIGETGVFQIDVQLTPVP